MALIDQEFQTPRELRDAIARELSRRDAIPIMPVGKPSKVIQSGSYKAAFGELVRGYGGTGVEVHLPPITVKDIGLSVCVVQVNSAGTFQVYASAGTTISGVTDFATAPLRMRRVVATTETTWCLEY